MPMLDGLIYERQNGDLFSIQKAQILVHKVLKQFFLLVINSEKVVLNTFFFSSKSSTVSTEHFSGISQRLPKDTKNASLKRDVIPCTLPLC
jgi:hypothetical protein